MLIRNQQTLTTFDITNEIITKIRKAMHNESNEAPKNTARELLSKSLQELTHQMEPGDTKAVAKKLGLQMRTVQLYLKGDLDAIDTGKKIFTELRAIIMKREQEIKKLVA